MFAASMLSVASTRALKKGVTPGEKRHSMTTHDSTKQYTDTHLPGNMPPLFTGRHITSPSLPSEVLNTAKVRKIQFTSVMHFSTSDIFHVMFNSCQNSLFFSEMNAMAAG